MCHALIIEDEPFIALGIQDLLEEQGVDTVDIAATEDEAVHSALSRQPDLITADVTLLDGNGPAAVGKIRDELGEIPVIYITGTPDRIPSLPRSSAILIKPFSAGLFRKTFAEAVEGEASGC
ncbi:response regulator [uncultured Sphingomonas sp.]|uniref:response regulator n=1 Tax=uncultured Sphingomonas sp. TaxID=158754 RepID=UPI0025ED8FFB|nr:response regulator [uncultured Sphingomonas sp.]